MNGVPEASRLPGFFVEKPHINDACALKELKFLEIFYDVVK